MTLNEVPVGEVCTVVKLNGTGALKRRIMDMGITKGTEIQVVKIAPLGDPMELNLRVTICRFGKMRLPVLR